MGYPKGKLEIGNNKYQRGSSRTKENTSSHSFFIASTDADNRPQRHESINPEHAVRNLFPLFKENETQDKVGNVAEASVQRRRLIVICFVMWNSVVKS